MNELSNRLEVTQNAAIGLLRIIGQADVPLERLPEKLVEVAAQYKLAMDWLAALNPQEPIISNLKESAETAMKAGRFDDADRLVSEAEQVELAATQYARQLAQHAQVAAHQRLLAAAAHRGARGNIAMTRLYYLDAAQHFGEAADLLPPGHPDEKGRYLHAQGNALRLHGSERGDNAALIKAIEIYRLASREYTRDRVPLDWAMTQNNLGNALATLGRARERDGAAGGGGRGLSRGAGGKDARARAARLGDDAEQSRQRASERSGERESGTARLEEAVAAYRAALEERTRERVPLDWAMTQNNLGNALQTLGERESGTARLEEAVAAYRAALEERTRERVPLDWAMTQNNLGNALSSARRARERHGAAGGGGRRLPRGAGGMDARARAARLGDDAEQSRQCALGRSGERESGTARLEEAVAAYRAALEERTRERVPLDWAMTQNNLGNALSSARRAGERDGAAGGGGRRLSRRAGGIARASACRSTGRRRRTISATRS